MKPISSSWSSSRDSAAFAEVVYLRNGDQIMTDRSGRRIRVQTPHGLLP
jgi:hypothetical protein